MRRFKIFFDVQKEENWLNEMAEAGFTCVKVDLLGYAFAENKSKLQTIRIDAQGFRSKEVYEQYIELYTEYGWTHLAGTRYSVMQYWKREADEDAVLFSDFDSKKAHYRRLLQYYGGLAIVFFALFIIFMQETTYAFDPKGAYFTPGLWNKTGLDFLTAFLFETPFALGRFASPWLMFIFVICYLIVYIKYRKYLSRHHD